jgi:hypothetical protein
MIWMDWEMADGVQYLEDGRCLLGSQDGSWADRIREIMMLKL